MPAACAGVLKLHASCTPKVALRAGAKGQGRNPYSTLTIRAVNETLCIAILTKLAYHSRKGVMCSTPLSNGLGESGQNPLGRNVAHCTSILLLVLTIKCAGSTPLSNGLGESGQNPLGRNAAGCNGYSNEQTLCINTVSNYNTNILTSSPFSNNTSCSRLECSIKFWQQYMSAGSRIPQHATLPKQKAIQPDVNTTASAPN